MNRKIVVVSLFDGLSGARVAIDRAGINIEKYISSEISEGALKISNHNYPQDAKYRLGDVTKIDTQHLKKMIGDNDVLLIGGSPCQGFSLVGKRKGSSTACGIDVVSLEQYLQLKEDGFKFDGQSFLFWEYIRIKKELSPKYFLLENVNVSEKWIGMFNDTVGCTPTKINSVIYSAQSRPRMYWTNLKFSHPTSPSEKLEDILEDLPITKELESYMKGSFNGVSRLQKGVFNFIGDNKSRCLTTKTSHPNKFLIDLESEKYRPLTITELERLQTLPAGYTEIEGVTKAQRHEAIGNGFTIDVISSFLKNIDHNLKPIQLSLF